MPRKKDLLAKDTIPRRAVGNIIRQVATRRGLSRDAMAKLAGDAASQMSRLMNKHDEEFSVDRLAKIGVRMGCDIDLVIRPKARLRRGKVRVRFERGNR
jgi:transcriptional regulator with XRE-family HTH domain